MIVAASEIPMKLKLIGSILQYLCGSIGHGRTDILSCSALTGSPSQTAGDQARWGAQVTVTRIYAAAPHHQVPGGLSDIYFISQDGMGDLLGALLEGLVMSPASGLFGLAVGGPFGVLIGRRSSSPACFCPNYAHKVLIFPTILCAGRCRRWQVCCVTVWHCYMAGMQGCGSYVTLYQYSPCGQTSGAHLGQILTSVWLHIFF